MRLYFVEGWTASHRAVEILEAAGIQFDKISVESSPSSLSGYRNEFGITCLPTLTMVGARYAGLPAIEEFVKKELGDRKATEHDKDQRMARNTLYCYKVEEPSIVKILREAGVEFDQDMVSTESQAMTYQRDLRFSYYPTLIMGSGLVT